MISDSDTITLKDAAQHFGFSVYTLRYEAEQGRLTIYKIGKRYYTTPGDVKEMVQLCRVGTYEQAYMAKATAARLWPDELQEPAARRSGKGWAIHVAR